MHQHPRHALVARARRDLESVIFQLAYGLTGAELIGVLASIQQSLAKRMVFDERNPDDPDKGGDEA